jgi:hypothetical protein
MRAGKRVPRTFRICAICGASEVFRAVHVTTTFAIQLSTDATLGRGHRQVQVETADALASALV